MLFIVGFLTVLIERILELVIYGAFLNKKQKNSLTVKKTMSQLKFDNNLVFMITSVFILIFVSMGTSEKEPHTTLIISGYFLFIMASILRFEAMKALGARWSMNIYTQFYVVGCIDVVKTGIYRWMRHPVFFGAILEALSIPLIFSSRSAFVYSLFIHIPIVVYRAFADERECLIFYKESYLKYISEVPFFILLPKRLLKYINFISVKKNWYQSNAKCQIEFAWIVHPFSDEDVFTIFPKLKTLYLISKTIYRVIRDRMSKSVIYRTIKLGPIFSRGGSFTAGVGISPFILTKSIIRSNNTDISQHVIKSINLAKKSGAKIVSLAGAFSMFGNEGRDFAEKYGVNITNGKHLIAWSTITQILNSCDKININPKKATVSIIGVNLGLGRIILEYMKNMFRTIHLSKKTDGLLNKSYGSNIEVRLSLNEALADSDVVIFTVIGAGLDFSPKILRPGSIFCDATMPFYLARRIFAHRRDVLSLETSWIKLPDQFNSDYINSINGRLRSGSYVYGCLGEVILLSLAKRWEDYSLGSDSLTVAKINEIETLAKKYGFEVPNGMCSNYNYDQNDFGRIKNARKNIVSLGAQINEDSKIL